MPINVVRGVVLPIVKLQASTKHKNLNSLQHLNILLKESVDRENYASVYGFIA